MGRGFAPAEEQHPSEPSSSRRQGLRGLSFAAASQALSPQSERQDAANADESEYRAALQRHSRQQERVYGLLLRALVTPLRPDARPDDHATLVRNAAEWIVAGKCRLSVLAPTHDAMTRVKGKKALFDASVSYPQRGGSYPRDRSVTEDPRLTYYAPSVGGQMLNGDLLQIIATEAIDDHRLQAVMIHEVLHDADQCFPGQDYTQGPEEVFDDYQSEFRAYTLMSGRGSGREAKYGDPDKPAANAKPYAMKDPETGRQLGPVKTNFKNEWQERLAIAMFDYMPQFGRAYCTDPRFKAMADAFSRPRGGNNLNSVRIDHLRETVNAASAATSEGDPRIVALRAAAAATDALDREFLADRELSRPFWAHARRTLSATAFSVLETALFGRSSTPEPATYTVQAGDWLARIAQRFQVPVMALMKANPHLGPPARTYDRIYPGDQVTIPAS